MTSRGRSSDSFNELAESIEASAPLDTVLINVDVTDEDAVQKLFAEVTRAGSIHVVLNCAGFSNIGLITDLAVEDFRSVVDVCLNGGFIVAKHAGRNRICG